MIDQGLSLSVLHIVAIITAGT